MAKTKVDKKDLTAQKPAPVSVDKSRTVTITLQIGNPVIHFEGEWTTRDFRNILRTIPRAYRQFQVNKRKQGEARFVTEETSNA